MATMTDCGEPPSQMRFDMRTRSGVVPCHASPEAVKSDYLTNVMSPIGLTKVVRKTVRIIKRSGVEFDAVAFRGFSGALVGPLVACRLKKGFLAVRKHKNDENSHSNSPVEGAVRMDCRYIIIDDLISSGATVWNIVQDLNEYIYDELDGTGGLVSRSYKRKCVGVFLYNSWIDDAYARDPGYVYERAREIYSPYRYNPAEDEDESSIFLPVWEFKSKDA